VGSVDNRRGERVNSWLNERKSDSAVFRASWLAIQDGNDAGTLARKRSTKIKDARTWASAAMSQKKTLVHDVKDSPYHNSDRRVLFANLLKRD